MDSKCEYSHMLNDNYTRRLISSKEKTEKQKTKKEIKEVIPSADNLQELYRASYILSYEQSVSSVVE